MLTLGFFFGGVYVQVVAWLPNLEEVLEGVVRCLKPGGVFFSVEGAVRLQPILPPSPWPFWPDVKEFLRFFLGGGRDH